MRRQRSDISLRIFQALLWAYPRQFREEYGQEMLKMFRDMLRDAAPRGIAACVDLWMHTIVDVMYSALLERSEEMRGRTVLLLGSAMLGVAIAWVDSRPTWDDTGITAGVILLLCGILGAISPKQAWQWALAVGVWIPLAAIFWTHNYGSFLALIPAFLGAYSGAGIRSLIFPPPTQA